MSCLGDVSLIQRERSSGLPLSSYKISPLNLGSSHFSPISIGRCHTGESELWLCHPITPSQPFFSPNNGGAAAFSSHLFAPLHLTDPINILLIDTQSQLGSAHFPRSLSRSTASFLWAIFFRIVAMQRPITATAVHTNNISAC